VAEAGGSAIKSDRLIRSCPQTQLANQTVWEIRAAPFVLGKCCSDLVSALNLQMPGSEHLVDGPCNLFVAGVVRAVQHPGKLT
jgi:hypothetical protein